MNDLDRARELVAAARADFEPTRADRERVRRHLGAALASAGVAGSTVVTATAAAAQGGASLAGYSLVSLGKLLVGTVLVTVGTGTALVAASRALSPHVPAAPMHPRLPDAPPLNPTPEPVSGVLPPDSSSISQAAAPEAGSALSVEPASTGSPSRPNGAVRAPSAATPAPATSDGRALDAELSLLHEAKRAMTQADYGSADSALARLDREHPMGALVEERDALRAVLACKTGDATRNQKVATFRRRYAGSVYAPRVESACAPGASTEAPSTKSVTDPAATGH